MTDQFCIFEYCYRDADNFKTFEEIRLTSQWEIGDQNKIESCLFDEEFFIPEQVGLSSLQSEPAKKCFVPSDGDHVWHTIGNLATATQRQDCTLESWGTKTDFLDAFLSVSKWDEKLSPIYKLLMDQMQNGSSVTSQMTSL